MPLSTAAGTTIEIGTTLADTEADSYTNIGKVANLGNFGRVYQPIEFSSLDDRNVLKFKGQRDDGNITMELGRDLSDAGQAAVKVALDSDYDYNFRVILNDESADSGSSGTVYYFKAKVMSFTTNVNDPNSVVGASVDLAIKSGSLDEIAAT